MNVCTNEHILSQCYLLKSAIRPGCDGSEHMNMDPVVIVTVGDSGLCCCMCVTSFELSLTPFLLIMDSVHDGLTDPIS